ncbi:34703_t:CDS:2, partial [Racocetra persica]
VTDVSKISNGVHLCKWSAIYKQFGLGTRLALSAGTTTIARDEYTAGVSATEILKRGNIELITLTNN